MGGAGMVCGPGAILLAPSPGWQRFAQFPASLQLVNPQLRVQPGCAETWVLPWVIPCSFPSSSWAL